MGGDAVADVAGVRAAGEDGRDHLAFGVDGCVAGVSGSDEDAEVGDEEYDVALVVLDVGIKAISVPD